MSAANQLPFLMTAATFLDWQTPDGSDRWELIDGIPRAMAPPSDRHGLIHGEAGRLIGNYLAEQRPESSESVSSQNDYNVRIPDITVSCGQPVVDDRLLAEPIVWSKYCPHRTQTIPGETSRSTPRYRASAKSW